jgi:hypothetical protein
MKRLTDKQLAANRANAARSTGPRTPTGKARAAQNARRHGLAADTYSAYDVEEEGEVHALLADAMDFYCPQNSQEQFAVERIALAQLAMLRAARFEAGALATCFRTRAADDDRTSYDYVECSFGQIRSHVIFSGLQRVLRDSNAFALVLRYQAQAERQYRRAVEEFNRLRSDCPNEPIHEPEPEQTKIETPAQNEPVPARDSALPSGLLRVSSASSVSPRLMEVSPNPGNCEFSPGVPDAPLLR